MKDLGRRLPTFWEAEIDSQGHDLLAVVAPSLDQPRQHATSIRQLNGVGSTKGYRYMSPRDVACCLGRGVCLASL